MTPETAGFVINPTHYQCKNETCGFRNIVDAFGYLGFSTIRCCPECGGTDLTGIREGGDGGIVEER